MNRLIRARLLVVATCVSATVAQCYAFFAQSGSPNSAVYAPNPYFLTVFFVMETGLQFYWIMQLFSSEREPRNLSLLSEDAGWSGVETEKESGGEPAQMAYVALYAISNVFLVASSFAWQFGQFAASQICMAFNTACHLYFIFFVIHPTGKHPRTQKNKLTHLVAKTSAGLALLYMWRVWGVIEIAPHRPTIQQQAHCGVLIFLLAFASGPDPTLGICLLLDLAALAWGETQQVWKFAFFCIMGVLSVVIASDYTFNGRASQPVSFSRDVSEDEEFTLHDLSEEIYLADLTIEGSHHV
ncbi:hypothetical protein K438DRAFT_612761 [Mycena galopus ATCC 62051]|nr:hypothetical protein K438DRAFT_612761 [Mycena galopus ATCC 62051]